MAKFFTSTSSTFGVINGDHSPGQGAGREGARGRGGDLRRGFDDAYVHARELEAERGLSFVHPFDDPEVIAGQGTIGMEILRQWQGPIGAIFVPIGGGGLVAGIASYVKRVRPEIKVIGVEPIDSDAMSRSLAAGRRVSLTAWGSSRTAWR